jgi:hypothetical protein
MRSIALPFVVLSACLGLVANSAAQTVTANQIENPIGAGAPGTSTLMPPADTGLAPSLTGPPAKRATASRVFSRPAVTAPVFTRPIVEPQVTNQTKQALGFYGGYAARATLSEQPRRTRIQATASRPMFRQTKPFQTVYREPTVSPYLNLHREERNNESAPNYFAFVRPQLDQIEANRTQQRDIQQLRGQLQATSTVVGPQYRASELPGTGTPARYMDTAQFYNGMRR